MCNRLAATALVLVSLIVFSDPGVVCAQTRHENPAAAANNRLPWEVARTPILEVGGSATDPSQQFFGVMDGLRLPDGRIAIANGGTAEVRVYRPDGSFETSIGGRGSGPGEFQRIATVAAGTGGSLYVFDDALQRLSIFRPDGVIEQTITRTDEPALGKVLRTAAGSWIGRSQDRTIAAPAGGTSRDTVRYLQLDEYLQGTSYVASTPGMVTVSIRLPTGDLGYRGGPFSPVPVEAVIGSCLLVADTDSWDFSLHSADGQRIHEVSNAWPRPRVTAADRDIWQEALLVAVPAEARPVVETTFRGIGMPEHLPAYHDVIVDALGYVWLQRYASPFGPGSEWVVFGPDGLFVGGITMPRPLQILEIGGNEILAVARDEFDEEIVQVYRLERLTTEATPPAGCT